jgi:hypothetical protein
LRRSQLGGHKRVGSKWHLELTSGAYSTSDRALLAIPGDRSGVELTVVFALCVGFRTPAAIRPYRILARHGTPSIHQ